MQTQRTYWAAETEAKKFIARAMERFQWAQTNLEASGRGPRLRSLVSAYYGRGTDGMRNSSRMRETGEQGEVSELQLNGVKPIVQNSLSLIAGQPPAVKPVSTNGDSTSAAQTRLALGLHGYYERRVDGQSRWLDTIRGGILASSWVLAQSWVPTDGAEWGYDPDAGKTLYEGDVQEYTLPPWRYAFDPSAQSEDARKWIIFRRPQPRWDTAANLKDEALAERLLRAQETAKSDRLKQQESLDALLGESLPDEDVVWVWEVRHLPSPALPQGRLVRFVEPDIILWDSLEKGVGYVYEKKELHAYEYAPERVISGLSGHSSHFDLLGLQELLDLVATSVATTVNLNGMPHLWSPPTQGAPTVNHLSTGPAILESAARPEVLDFPALKPEVVEAGNWALERMREAAALNNTVMGNPDKGMPASAQALQRAQAVQYHAVAQAEAIKLLRKQANGRLRLLKRFATSKRTAEIAGEAGAYEVAEWQAEDISDVERFEVEVVDPLSQSYEQRQAVGQQLLELRAIDVEGFVDFLQTGNLRKSLEGKTAAQELVDKNVALLRKGVGLPPIDAQAMAKQQQAIGAGLMSPQDMTPTFLEDGGTYVRPLKSDPHHVAIPAYLAVANSPAARGDAKLVTACLDVASESLRLWQTLTPDECVAFGVPQLPSHMMPPPPPPGAGAPLGPDAPPAADNPLPKPPPNPINGNQASEASLNLPPPPAA